ncbi:glutathione S-transferase family protein [Niveispirillum cyanobacteriorum]|uniref:Glutathione S-transferase n=1 Tax=Niveispirillum cyanobacteriorum TaxID=1612173 RepID=A0A2K9NG87_9PROT|nr:glutathione S-transferase family protein [Niveispirillum cyanobacteriorum]AUN32097.1 glutathione S-transferase [Niveispirillum cyanobacteriorum]GGE74151.1 glutathione S-transferase [Niveispirillum cyanobacteriorum]
MSDRNSAPLTLVMGNKAYSSWSLRPWLALRHAGADFAEVVVPLRQPDTKAVLLSHAPSGKAPSLRHGDLVIWDSLAICEYLNELFPAAQLWPADAAVRAVARAVSAEMHSGFPDLRKNLFMDVRSRFDRPDRVAAAQTDIDRVLEIWTDCRARFGGAGPFLFGAFSIADAMFAPVATRLRTWNVPLNPVSAAYVETIHTMPAMVDWVDAAKAEPWVVQFEGM